MTQIKHKRRQTMETNDTRFCEKSFIDRSFLVFEILRGGGKKKQMASRVK